MTEPCNAGSIVGNFVCLLSKKHRGRHKCYGADWVLIWDGDSRERVARDDVPGRQGTVAAPYSGGGLQGNLHLHGCAEQTEGLQNQQKAGGKIIRGCFE